MTKIEWGDNLDAQAIIKWIDGGMKPDSGIAFTAGENRRCAWLCEYAVAQGKRKALLSPEGNCYECQESDGNTLCGVAFCDCPCHRR